MSVESLLGRRRTVLFPLCGGRAEDAARRRSWSWRGGCAGGCKGLPSPHQQTPRSPFVSWPRLLPSSSLQDPPCTMSVRNGFLPARSIDKTPQWSCLPACLPWHSVHTLYARHLVQRRSSHMCRPPPEEALLCRTAYASTTVGRWCVFIAFLSMYCTLLNYTQSTTTLYSASTCQNTGRYSN